ncbi:uncharacterized protein LOC124945677 [Impatiens glandulifera]|uniref:uncharacterized protein LOC124945677 n=1 Tax=Impatiens glandulifera TaxID=253017 RepID=UPI001FB0E92D|nr:uncharacterized protein LOC124945677 [Impatiens glandulifera]
MGNNLILNCSRLHLSFLKWLIFISLCLYPSLSYELPNEGGQYNSFTVSSFSYPKTQLKSSDWRYIKVDLPPLFSSVSFNIESDADTDLKSIHRIPPSKLQLICLRFGSLPVPDALNSSLTDLVLGNLSNGSFGNLHELQAKEICYPMQNYISSVLTNEQIPAGIWYLGLFNGIGPTRTQSKMINRGSSFSFSANISVDGCTTSALWGQYCNQTVDALSCSTGDLSNIQHESNQTEPKAVLCRTSDTISCLNASEPKVYSLEISGIVEELSITVTNVSLSQPSVSNETILMAYARLGAVPLASIYDYSANISNEHLILRYPKAGNWYIRIYAGSSGTICYSVNARMLQCPRGKTGLNCTSKTYPLQTVVRKNPAEFFESHFSPITGVMSSTNFPLEPLLNGSISWTYFLLEVPYAAAGGHLHIQLSSETKISSEIFVRHSGLPTTETFDHFYANTTSNSNGSMFLKLNGSNEKKVDFYILFVRGGTWAIGLKYPSQNNNSTVTETDMSVSLERCPRKCSSPPGKCSGFVDASGLQLYSYCSCGRDHGGMDCSIEIVSRRGHIWQSIFLIASNAAAILPAYSALSQKAFAEWILFTSSGISSGLYHACDVGTWCVLKFDILQFMDFWLSFMAVVSTFVYLVDISETSKRTIHTIVAILTAIMAEAGPTRSSNIVIVMAIGIAGLVVGLLIEYCSKFRHYSPFPVEFRLNALKRWETLVKGILDIFKTLIKRFRWCFLLVAFIFLAMAAVCWTLESASNYWIWHSLWHITIYTSSFFFLCSKVNSVEVENDSRPSPARNYELTRQDSFSRTS